MELSPMLATLADAPLQSKLLVYEPKYDGIRALAEIDGGGKGHGPSVRLWSRNGNEKTSQFPTIVHALEAAARGQKGRLVLDGEIVALDEQGRPAGFQRLQGRMHLLGAKDVERAEQAQPAAFIAFDILVEGKEDLTRLPLTERRKRLEDVFLRLKADATEKKRGRTKPVLRQAFPKPTSRAQPPAAAASGVRLQAEDSAVLRLSEQVAGDAREMYARATKEGWEGLIAKDAASPYQPGRRTPAWRKIKLLQEQEFVVAGWTEPRQTRAHFGALLLGVYDNGILRYAGHTGTGFDQKELTRVARLLKARETKTSPFAEKIKTNEPAHWVRPDLVAQIRFTEWTADRKLRHPVYLGLRDDKAAKEVVAEFRLKAATTKADLQPVLDQLNALEHARKDGMIDLPGGERVKVTNPAKLFWPSLKLTKGDLLRYYVEVADLILPCVADRPLVMKRFPNGVGGQAFYQHKVAERGATMFVGGSLKTLLEMTQLAAISQDPWFSRVTSPHEADYAAIDLDPTEGATFATVLDVARWVREELHRLKVPGFAKTSGSSGLHIYVPLPPHTSYESGMLFCQIVATMVATRHPKQATVERAVARRAKGSVYVDYLQNIEGKTLATAYSARASAFAGVSTPLAWTELDGTIDPRDFTLRTAPARFREAGDLWAGLRTAPPADLEAVLRKY
jgi:bifunctional non-homologous end joining protein LigD